MVQPFGEKTLSLLRRLKRHGCSLSAQVARIETRSGNLAGVPDEPVLDPVRCIDFGVKLQT